MAEREEHLGEEEKGYCGQWWETVERCVLVTVYYEDVHLLYNIDLDGHDVALNVLTQSPAWTDCLAYILDIESPESPRPRHHGKSQSKNGVPAVQCVTHWSASFTCDIPSFCLA